MIKATELRIGNYLHEEKFVNGNSFKVVTEITQRDVVCMDRQVTSISPIINGFIKEKGVPLTKEWLLKFGFSELRPGNWFHSNPNFGWLGKKISYVHELQNLYFTLTQTEISTK